jgi:putative sigma-54 modulation protein
MQVTVTGRHPGITPHVKEYAESKVNRLERYFDGTQRIEVIMRREADDSIVELVITAGGRQIISECRDPDLYAAIDLVLDKAETQLTRLKEKRKEHRGKHAEGEGATSEEANGNEPA